MHSSEAVEALVGVLRERWAKVPAEISAVLFQRAFEAPQKLELLAQLCLELECSPGGDEQAQRRWSDAVKALDREDWEPVEVLALALLPRWKSKYATTSSDYQRTCLLTCISVCGDADFLTAEFAAASDRLKIDIVQLLEGHAGSEHIRSFLENVAADDSLGEPVRRAATEHLLWARQSAE